jgi:hypothetical protein
MAGGETTRVTVRALRVGDHVQRDKTFWEVRSIEWIPDGVLDLVRVYVENPEDPSYWGFEVATDAVLTIRARRPQAEGAA